jgi:RES domain-containing protein
LIATSAFSRVEQRTIRLIPSAHHKPPVLEPLAATFGARSHLEQLESVTSGRQRAQQEGIPGISASALATGYGYSYINAAFAYARHDGSRFNPKDWGAWYSAFDVQTSLQEVSFHLARALAAAEAHYDNTTYYVELLADFNAEFCDLRGVEPIPDFLQAETSIAYPLGQAFANELRKGGANGIVYPSVRHSGGTCLVAFWPGLIRNFQRGETWILKWMGDPTPVIAKLLDD